MGWQEERMRQLFNRFIRDASGSNALEYGLIIAFVSLAVVLGATAAGGSLNTMFTSIATELGIIAGSI
jgi:pilus assembly protein Flp/PilA